jgi:hypothetical protein
MKRVDDVREKNKDEQLVQGFYTMKKYSHSNVVVISNGQLICQPMFNYFSSKQS